MPPSGEYEPSPIDRVREQVELYEATNGVEGSTERTGDHSADLQGCEVRQASQDASHEDRAQRHLRRGRFERRRSSASLLVPQRRGQSAVRAQVGAIRQKMRDRQVFGREGDEWWKRANAAYSEFSAYRAVKSRCSSWNLYRSLQGLEAGSGDALRVPRLPEMRSDSVLQGTALDSNQDGRPYSLKGFVFSSALFLSIRTTKTEEPRQ